jgi:hypothetical protein
MRDYLAIVERFHALNDQTDGEAHLLFTGDLVHGPHIDEEQWPEFLGEYYRDQSADLMRAFVELRRDFPGQIHALLGNHEHGHIGGPHTAKFALDEVALLETMMGEEGAAWLRSVLADLPLVAIAPCGAVFTHGAPAASIKGPDDIESAALDSTEWGSPLDILDVPVVGPILWARSAEEDAARRFAAALGGHFTIYGHDVIPTGFERIGDEQMVVSTSFGVFDHSKVYLELDLTRKYRSVRDLEVGREILPLYPSKAPPELGGSGPSRRR